MQDNQSNNKDGFYKKLWIRKTILLVYLFSLLSVFIYVPQFVYYEGNKISWPYTFIWSNRAPVAQVDFSKIFLTVIILSIILAIVLVFLPKNRN